MGRDERLWANPPPRSVSAPPPARDEAERDWPEHARRTGSGVWEPEPRVHLSSQGSQSEVGGTSGGPIVEDGLSKRHT